jgi:hypothetical protein
MYQWTKKSFFKTNFEIFSNGFGDDNSICIAISNLMENFVDILELCKTDRFNDFAQVKKIKDMTYDLVEALIESKLACYRKAKFIRKQISSLKI